MELNCLCLISILIFRSCETKWLLKVHLSLFLDLLWLNGSLSWNWQKSLLYDHSCVCAHTHTQHTHTFHQLVIVLIKETGSKSCSIVRDYPFSSKEKKKSNFHSNRPSHAYKQSNKQRICEIFYNTICSLSLCNKHIPIKWKQIAVFKIYPVWCSCFKALFQRIFDFCKSQPCIGLVHFPLLLLLSKDLLPSNCIEEASSILNHTGAQKTLRQTLKKDSDLLNCN